jgi:tetratricopeptide (TPR) repeat protein
MDEIQEEDQNTVDGIKEEDTVGDIKEEEEEDFTILDEFKEDFALMIECGFIGAKQLDEINSTRLFNAAQILNPTSSAPLLGLGHIALSKMDIRKATQLFEEALASDENNYLGYCFLGICYFMTKDKMKKGEKLIKSALENSDDETVQKLGNIILEWGEKDLSKRSKSPFEP